MGSDGHQQHLGMPVLPSARFTEFTRNNGLITGPGASLGKSAATISYYDSSLEPAVLNRVTFENRGGLRSSVNG